MSLEPLRHEIFGGEGGIVHFFSQETVDGTEEKIVLGTIPLDVQNFIDDPENAALPSLISSILVGETYARRTISNEYHFAFSAIHIDPNDHETWLRLRGRAEAPGVLWAEYDITLGGTLFNASYINGNLMEIEHKLDDPEPESENIDDFLTFEQPKLEATIEQKLEELGLGFDLKKMQEYVLNEICKGDSESYEKLLNNELPFWEDTPSPVGTSLDITPDEDSEILMQIIRDHFEDIAHTAAYYKDKEQSSPASNAVVNRHKGKFILRIFHRNGLEIKAGDIFDQDFTVSDGEITDTYRCVMENDCLRIIKKKPGGRIITISAPLTCDVSPEGTEDIHTWLKKMQRYAQLFKREETFEDLT